MTHGEGLLYTCYGEECETEGVKDKPCIVEPAHPLAEDDNKEECQCRTFYVYGIGHPEGSDSEGDVTQSSSANCNRKAADITTKPIKTLAGGMTDTGDGEGKGSYELDGCLQGMDVLWVEHWTFRIFLWHDPSLVGLLSL